MRASSGEHYVGLEHVRGLAAFLVFVWHFLHINSGHLVGLTGTFTTPVGPLLSQGHTGVALFMVLSGYLFAKLTSGRDIICGSFLWNRIIRLLPLVALLTIARPLYWVAIGDWHKLTDLIADPPFPKGSWSIWVELQFYLLFPFVLMIEGRFRGALPFILAVSMMIRVAAWSVMLPEDFWWYSYHTLLGRFDQFLLGIMFARFGDRLAGKHLWAALVAGGFMSFWYAFAWFGGQYEFSERALWIILPTIEGATFAFLVSWYDHSFRFRNAGISAVFAKVGEVSYSIYLLHFYVVFRASEFINANVMPLTNFYVMLAWAIVCFVPVVLLSWVSYATVETSLMRFRTRYVREKGRGSSEGEAGQVAAA